MPAPNRKYSVDRRRALQVLAAAPDGCTEAILLAHGIELDLLFELVRDGLAIARTERARRRDHAGDLCQGPRGMIIVAPAGGPVTIR